MVQEKGTQGGNVSTYLTADELIALDKIADKNKVSRAAIIKQAIRDFLIGKGKK